MSPGSARKWRIGYVFPGAVDRMGGAETQAMHFFRHFDRDRFEISLILLGENRAFQERCATVPDLKVYVLPAPIPLGFLAFLRRVRRSRYDLVHLYGLRVEVLARPIAALLGPCKVVSAVRGVESHRGWLAILLNRLTGRWVDLWISNSERARRVFIERDKVDPDRITVVRSGVPDTLAESRQGTREELRARMGLSATDFVAVLVGNHVKGKRQIDLVEAVAKCATEGRTVYMWMLGARSNYSEVFEQCARARGVEKLIQLSGPTDRVHEFLAAADVFVLPSLDEGVPAAVLEAMMAALPVIATNVGGTAEAVIDGETGFLIPIMRPDLLASKIGVLYDEPALRERLGMAGRARVLAEYGVARLTRELEEIYEARMS